MEPPGPAGACHRAGPMPDPVGRPDDELRVIRDRLTPDYASLHPGYRPLQAALSFALITKMGAYTACLVRKPLAGLAADR